MGTSHRQRAVKDVVGARAHRALRALLAARRLRGRARQRRHDRVLGRRGGLPHPRALAPPHLRRVLVQVREGHGRRARTWPTRSSTAPIRRRARPARRRGRRRDLLGPQRDLDRRHGPGRAPRRRGRRAGPDRRHLGRRGPAARPGPGRRLLLRAAEGPRVRGRHLARAPEPRRDRAHRRARRRRGPLAARVPEALDRARQLAQGPDLQHARRGDAAPPRRPARVDDWKTAASTGASSGPAAPRATSTAGPRRPSSRRRSSRTSASARSSSARSTSRRRSTPPRSPRRSAPTASSTPSRTASSGATSSGSGCSRPSSPQTSRRSPRASTG